LIGIRSGGYVQTRFSKTEAVVLNAVRFGDGHKIVNFLTPGFGKIEASAFGVRKTKSRFGSRLEPFTVAQVLLYRKSEESIFTVREVDVVHAHRAIREDLFRFIVGSCMIEPVVRFVEKGETDRTLFNLLSDSLDALDDIEMGRGMYLLSMYDIKLFAVLGYSPTVNACRRCGSPIVREGSVFFDRTNGLPLCGRCGTVSSASLTRGARDFFEWALGHQPCEARKVKMRGETLRSLRGAIECLYMITFHRKPQSWSQLDEIPARL
jgi:DNA repair protein RecO (recombination protein O)